MTFSKIYSSILFIFLGASFLQAQVSTCDLQNDADAVTVDYNVISEVENGDGTCDYVLGVTISADDGVADSDISVTATIEINGSAVLQATRVLPMGSASQSFPMNNTIITLPCGQTGTITTQITGQAATCASVPTAFPFTKVNVSHL